ncbi:hypothetical protein BHE74_00036344 [Ensete ventricosum]|nr:hypothetical protein BHE74_00036344 [Ensete ventricosum]
MRQRRDATRPVEYVRESGLGIDVEAVRFLAIIAAWIPIARLPNHFLRLSLLLLLLLLLFRGCARAVHKKTPTRPFPSRLSFLSPLQAEAGVCCYSNLSRSRSWLGFLRFELQAAHNIRGGGGRNFGEDVDGKGKRRDENL